MRGLLGALLVCWFCSAQAAEEYWVAVGSFRDEVNAERARTQAAGVLPESFSVSPFDNGNRRVYRVVAGPYLTRSAAELMIVQSQQSGYADAWLLVTDPGEIRSDVFSGGELPDYTTELDLDDLPDVQTLLPPAREQTAPERRMVDEAPPGYGLHKLHRESRYLSPLRPWRRLG